MLSIFAHSGYNVKLVSCMKRKAHPKYSRSAVLWGDL
jgi:hypothetical protein